MSLGRRRYFVTFVALCGLGVTWGVMVAFDWVSKLGIVTFVPWAALMAFDLGALGGLCSAAAAATLYLVTANAQNVVLDNVQIGVRLGSMIVLGLGAGLAGDRLRSSERAQRGVAALQSALIDSTLDGICLTDEHGEILISNKPLRYLARELGMPQEGSVPERLIAIADRLAEPERYRARMRDLSRTTGEASLDEFELRGSGRVFRGYTAPVQDPDGSFVGRVWTLREVTADRELDRMRDAFVATVSHELRTPLTSISGFLEMMQEEEQALGESGKRYLDVIRRSTERLHALVEDLLLIAQIEAKRVELDLLPVDVVDLATSAVEGQRPAADEKGVTVEIVADHPPIVRADRTRLTQVLDNLVSNAVKFTNEGGTVRVHIAGKGDAVELVITDTGIGIPPDEQGQLFSRFFRASTATQHAIPGTGLGLSISRALVEQHGGTISVESAVGEGTQVTISIPATP
ncbi:MAG TPA: ATP-binding protein [Gaiellaceae bacterium]